MKRFYDRSMLHFTLLWIGAYVVLFSLADHFSSAIGTEKVITAPLSIFFALALVLFLVRHQLMAQHGLCKYRGSYKGVLFFLPILPILGLYLWGGLSIHGTALQAILPIVAMLFVGFIEELLFRGLLFTAMRRDNLKAAVLVSSLTFGLGHIVNLVNGRAPLSTLLQVCYATALGFLLTMVYVRGRSLLPCIAFHSLFNVLSLFHVSGSALQSIVSSAGLCLICASYGLWIWRQMVKEGALQP